jgi:FHS family glucose/mannose:H+ symporter-like MFS transporter
MTPPNPSPPGLASSSALYAAFAATGFATALLGATLPVMLVHWSLTDRRGGLLFLIMFLGSSSGALLSRGRATHSLARGTLLLFLACIALAFAEGRTVFPIALLYGLGLGITITSISLLRVERRAAIRARELNRLNLIWAAGAFSCPWLANEILRRSSVRTLFLLLAAAFAVMALWTALSEVRLHPSPRSTANKSPFADLRLPLILAVAAVLATGIESSMGAWIATYADRLRNNFEAPVAAASIFWFGLLASRAIHSTSLLARFSERFLLRSGSAVVALGCALLIAAHHQPMLLCAAFLTGFGIGPIYPLLLAVVLPRVRGNTIFLMGGLGGATFPLLTGTLSSQAHSLRTGLLIPALGGVLLFALMGPLSRKLSTMTEHGH